MTILGRGPLAVVAAILGFTFAGVLIAVPRVAKNYNLAPWARRALVLTAIAFGIWGALIVADILLPNTVWRSIVTDAWLFIGGLIAGLMFALVYSGALSKKARLRDGAKANQALCVECKQLFNLEDMVSHHGVFVCAACKPVFLQRLAEGAVAPAPERSGSRTL
jgi:hypothetical protein